MNGMISLQISDEALTRANRALRQIFSQSPQAVARAVNRTMDGLRTDAVRETHKKYFVSAKDVYKTITFRPARAGNLMGEMVSTGKRHSLKDYRLTPTEPSPGRKTKLKGAVKKEGGLKQLSHGFLFKRKGGGYFPYYRVGYDPESRKFGKMKSYISPSMPQIIKNEDTVRVMEQGAAERFEKRLNHEFMQLLGVLP